MPREQASIMMKKCPFCATEIQDQAERCGHCGELLDTVDIPDPGKEGMPWYFRTSFIVFAVACVGPLALPLIWWRPRTSRAWKIALTLGIVMLSWSLYQMTVESVHLLKDYYQLLKGM